MVTLIIFPGPVQKFCNLYIPSTALYQSALYSVPVQFSTNTQQVACHTTYCQLSLFLQLAQWVAGEFSCCSDRHNSLAPVTACMNIPVNMPKGSHQQLLCSVYGHSDRQRGSVGSKIIYITRVTIFSIVKPTRCTTSQIYFILEQHSTHFGRSLRPSSGVSDCTYSTRYMSYRFCGCLLAQPQNLYDIYLMVYVQS